MMVPFVPIDTEIEGGTARDKSHEIGSSGARKDCYGTRAFPKKYYDLLQDVHPPEDPSEKKRRSRGSQRVSR